MYTCLAICWIHDPREDSWGLGSAWLRSQRRHHDENLTASDWIYQVCCGSLLLSDIFTRVWLDLSTRFMHHLRYGRGFPPPVTAHASLSYPHLEDYLPVTILSLPDMLDSPHLTPSIEQIIGTGGLFPFRDRSGISISYVICLGASKGICCKLFSTPFVCYHSAVTYAETRWDLVGPV